MCKILDATLKANCKCRTTTKESRIPSFRFYLVTLTSHVASWSAVVRDFVNATISLIYIRTGS